MHFTEDKTTNGVHNMKQEANLGTQLHIYRQYSAAFRLANGDRPDR